MLRIAPPRGWLDIDFKELWAARELLYFFVWRDIKVRYKQTAIGAAWAVIQPFMTMVVFSLFFGKLAKMDSHGLPYPIFYYSALLPWMYFCHGLAERHQRGGRAAARDHQGVLSPPGASLVRRGRRAFWISPSPSWCSSA